VEGDLQRAVGANLRAYRLARDLSQETFADVLGVHRTYMGAIERGERNLTLRSVERLADRLDVGALELLRAGAAGTARGGAASPAEGGQAGVRRRGRSRP
jgi:transcriptional regulator with XRE-family HTH domain